MENIIWFDVCAVILVALLLVLYYKKFSAPFQKYSLFLLLLWLNLISGITSLASFVLPGHVPLWVLRLLNALYFFAHGATPAQVLLAFLLTKPGVLPIPRTGRALHTVENADAAALRLTAEELAALDAAFPPPKRKMPLDMQ